MSKALYRAVLHLHAEVCQDGIGRIRLVGPEEAFAAQDIDVMAVLCTAFCQQQIVVAVFLVDMWPLRIPAAKTSPQVMDLAKPFAALHIDLTYLVNTYLTLSAKNQTEKRVLTSFFEKLIGSKKIRAMLDEGLDAKTIAETWKDDVKRFKEQRKPYLLYKE